jgi:glyoxylase-like metal-dependent hydrolase (beta-lactamase superfamily II)
MQQIKPGIFYENSYLGVTLGALVFSHGTVYIDAPLRPEDARSWRSTLINQRGGTNRLLITLDAHLDRTLGARALECPIVAHEQAASVFQNRPSIFKGQTAESGAEWETYHEAVGTRWAPPDITYTTQMILHWGGPDIQIQYHPGPALGSTWVIVADEKVAFVGDTVMIEEPPFLSNANLETWLDELEVLKKDFRDYTVISGRGGLTTKDHVRAQQSFIKTVQRSLERLAKREASPEDTESEIPKLLKKLTFPPEKEEQYYQRLKTGLNLYYSKKYQAAITAEIEEEEAAE